MAQYITQCLDIPVVNNGVVSCTGSMTLDPVLTNTDIYNISTELLVIIVSAWTWRAIGSLIYKVRG
jgi:hypothetical protein